MRAPALALLCALTADAHSAESDHADPWCEARAGIIEHRLADRRRVDCLTTSHAIEVDFARKWAEGIGQALAYGLATGRRPGLALIVTEAAECRFYGYVVDVRDGYALPLDVWTIGEACP